MIKHTQIETRTFMGCRILEDSDNGACFYCSTTGAAFGPIMANREEAELFLNVINPTDPRTLTERELFSKYADFCHDHVCECGNLRDDLDAEIKAEDENGGCTCEDDTCARCVARDHYLVTFTTERFVCYQCTRKLRTPKGRAQFKPTHFKQRAQ